MIIALRRFDSTSYVSYPVLGKLLSSLISFSVSCQLRFFFPRPGMLVLYFFYDMAISIHIESPKVRTESSRKFIKQCMSTI